MYRSFLIFLWSAWTASTLLNLVEFFSLRAAERYPHRSPWKDIVTSGLDPLSDAAATLIALAVYMLPSIVALILITVVPRHRPLPSVILGAFSLLLGGLHLIVSQFLVG